VYGGQPSAIAWGRLPPDSTVPTVLFTQGRRDRGGHVTEVTISLGHHRAAVIRTQGDMTTSISGLAAAILMATFLELRSAWPTDPHLTAVPAGALSRCAQTHPTDSSGDSNAATTGYRRHGGRAGVGKPLRPGHLTVRGLRR
jgi:hypothetical protein